MSFYNTTKMGANDVYKQMLAEKKQVLDEGITASNSIHSDVESTMKDFAANLKSSVDAEAIEEKLRDLEKDEMTNLDKKVISAIRKLVTSLDKSLEDFKKFQKDLKYEYIVNKKNVPEAAKDDVDEEGGGSDIPSDSEADLNAAGDQFEETPSGEEAVKVESLFKTMVANLTEAKAPYCICRTDKDGKKKYLTADGKFSLSKKNCKCFDKKSEANAHKKENCKDCDKYSHTVEQ